MTTGRLLKDEILGKGRDENEKTCGYDFPVNAPEVCLEVLSCKDKAEMHRRQEHSDEPRSKGHGDVCEGSLPTDAYEEGEGASNKTHGMTSQKACDKG